MRKIIVGLMSTISGLVLLFSYHTSLNRMGPSEPLSLGASSDADATDGAASTSDPTPTDEESADAEESTEPTTSPTDDPAEPDASADETPTQQATTDSTTKADPGTRTTTARPRTSAAARTTAKKTTKPAGVSGSFTGETVQTRWGPVQVRITVKDNRITGVTAVQYPGGNPKNEEINAYCLPILAQRALSAQGADFDGVSGATVTSDGYRTSMQSALDQAHL